MTGNTGLTHGIARELRELLEESEVEAEDPDFHNAVETLKEYTDFLEEKWENDSNLFNYQEKTAETAERLDLSIEEFIDAALDRPSLFYRSPDTVLSNIETVADGLGVDTDSYVDAALVQPSLFYRSPDTVLSNIETVADGLGVDTDSYVDAALVQPSLFSQSPDTVLSNIETVADGLGVDTDSYVDAALDRPSLFSQSPDTILRHNSWVHSLEEEGLISIPGSYGGEGRNPVDDYMCQSPHLFSLADDNFELRLFNGKILDKDPYMKNLTGPKYESMQQLEEHVMRENGGGVLDSLAREDPDLMRDHLPKADDPEIGNYARSVAYDGEVVQRYLEELEQEYKVSEQVQTDTRGLMQTV